MRGAKGYFQAATKVTNWQRPSSHPLRNTPINARFIVVRETKSGTSPKGPISMTDQCAVFEVIYKNKPFKSVHVLTLLACDVIMYTAIIQ